MQKDEDIMTQALNPARVAGLASILMAALPIIALALVSLGSGALTA